MRFNMKKIRSILFSFLALSIVAILPAISPTTVLSQKKMLQTSNSIPHDVMDIFRNSCIDCHGEPGNFSARSTLNFYVWDNYSHEKKLEKASAIINVLTMGTMPPASAKSVTPQIILTTERSENVCSWAKSLVEGNERCIQKSR